MAQPAGESGSHPAFVHPVDSPPDTLNRELRRVTNQDICNFCGQPRVTEILTTKDCSRGQWQH
jgi:hypothetical protein